MVDTLTPQTFNQQPSITGQQPPAGAYAPDYSSASLTNGGATSPQSFNYADTVPFTIDTTGQGGPSATAGSAEQYTSPQHTDNKHDRHDRKKDHHKEHNPAGTSPYAAGDQTSPNGTRPQDFTPHDASAQTAQFAGADPSATWQQPTAGAGQDPSQTGYGIAGQQNPAASFTPATGGPQTITDRELEQLVYGSTPQAGATAAGPNQPAATVPLASYEGKPLTDDQIARFFADQQQPAGAPLTRLEGQPNAVHGIDQQARSASLN